MGVTAHSISLIEKALSLITVTEVMELGSQNLFDKEYGENKKHDGLHCNNPYSSEYYKSKGIKYNCIDLNGENQAYKLDLEIGLPKEFLKFEQKLTDGTPWFFERKYKLVTDFGTGEHVRNSYSVFKNIHDLLEVGGICIRENPKTGNWSGHGFNYMTTDIYKSIANANGYKIIELHEHPAMGNITDGWNVCCIYQKTHDVPFMNEGVFKLLNVPTT